jgi:hypothetical protein
MSIRETSVRSVICGCASIGLVIFRQLIEAWNQNQVLAKHGKNPHVKAQGRGFGMDVGKLQLPSRGPAPAPYGEPNRANTSQNLGSGPGKT